MKGNDVQQKDNGTDKVREGGKLHISPPSLPALQLQLIRAPLEVSPVQLLHRPELPAHPHANPAQ